MLEVKTNESFTGTSTIDDVTVERYSATISESNPESVTFTRVITNAQLRKDNRDKCRADMAEFEDQVYAVQDEMIANQGKVENTEDEDENEDEGGGN